MSATSTASPNVDARAAVSRPKRRRFLQSTWVLVPVTLVIFLVLWEIILDVLGVESFLLPKPSEIAASFVTSVARNPFGEGSLAQAAWSTYSAALSAFALATVLGILVAALAAESALVERLMFPYIVAFQTVPRIAIAPLVVLWFGNGISSKILMAVLVAFFPIVVNTLVGLKSTPVGRQQLMRYLDASWWQTYRYVRLPGAMPHIFAGMEVALVFSILGVVVTEFIGSKTGLGTIVLQAHFSLDVGGVFAVFVVLVAVGLVLRAVLVAVRRRALFWSETQRSGSL